MRNREMKLWKRALIVALAVVLTASVCGVAEEIAPEAPAVEPPEEAEPAAEEAAEEVPEVAVEVEAAEAGEEEIEDEETPLGVLPDAPAPSGSVASVRVERKDEDSPIYFGDRLTLIARVHSVGDYALRWQVNCQDEEGWQDIADEHGTEYDFIVTPENIDYEYRVVLTAA